ncbi:MAG: HK97 gp10 family phage protein [Allobaculum sp.]|nr:HK97 gp10 family phage protein [Allobaculum sp.]
MANISIEDLNQAVQEALEEYKELTTDDLKKAVTKTAKDTASLVREKAPVQKKSSRAGTYQASIRSTTVYEDTHSKRMKVWASGKEYTLSHLLEKGHDLVAHRGRNKGRVISHTKARPHFLYGEEYVEQNLEKNIKSYMEKSAKRKGK